MLIAEYEEESPLKITSYQCTSNKIAYFWTEAGADYSITGEWGTLSLASTNPKQKIPWWCCATSCQLVKWPLVIWELVIPPSSCSTSCSWLVAWLLSGILLLLGQACLLLATCFSNQWLLLHGSAVLLLVTFFLSQPRSIADSFPSRFKNVMFSSSCWTPPY